MRTWSHVIVGGAAAAAPDVLLLLFAWRGTWLPETHPLVKAHRFLHSPQAVLYIVALGWLTHVVTDAMSSHREAPE